MNTPELLYQLRSARAATAKLLAAVMCGERAAEGNHDATEAFRLLALDAQGIGKKLDSLERRLEQEQCSKKAAWSRHLLR